MKAVKWFAGLIVAVLVVLAIVVAVGLGNLGKIVKAVVEEMGPQVVGTQVGLADASFALTEGRGELTGLTVANPEGFSRSNVFELGHIVLDIDPGSLTGEVIVIDEIKISNMDIRVEQKNLTDTNIQALLNNIQRNTATAAKSGPESSEATTSEVRLAVERFVFEKSDIDIVTEQWGDVVVSMPAIELNQLGSRTNGLTPAELAEAAVEPLLKSVQEQATKKLKDRAKEEVKERAEEKLKEKLSDELSDDDMKTLKSLFK